MPVVCRASELDVTNAPTFGFCEGAQAVSPSQRHHMYLHNFLTKTLHIRMFTVGWSGVEWRDENSGNSVMHLSISSDLSIDLLDLTVNPSRERYCTIVPGQAASRCFGEAFWCACYCVIEQPELATSRRRRVTACEVRVEIVQGWNRPQVQTSFPFFSPSSTDHPLVIFKKRDVFSNDSDCTLSKTETSSSKCCP